MDELSKEYVISFFDKNLMIHGDRPEAVRWSAEGQRRHYEALLDIGPIAGREILDYGCGKGDFLGFLSGQGIEVSYSGYDINPQLITLAAQKYPDGDFRVFDAEQETLDREFDYIFLCGVFNLKVQGVDEAIHTVISRLFGCCRIGLAFNALSAYNPKKDFELHYVYPDRLAGFALTRLSPYVALRHDRILYDFTLFVYKGPNQFRP